MKKLSLIEGIIMQPRFKSWWKPKWKPIKKVIKTVITTFIIVCFATILLLAVLNQRGIFDRTPQPNNDTEPKQNQSLKTYNGFEFNKELVGWSVLVDVGDNLYDLKMRYHPTEVEYIDIVNESGIKNRLLSSDIVFITMDPLMPSKVALSAMEISKVLNPRKNNTGILGIPAIIGVTHIPPTYPNKNTIIANCANASSISEMNNKNKTEPFRSIIKYELNQSRDNEIFIRDDCIIISGKNNTVLSEAGDRMVYSLLNIIP